MPALDSIHARLVIASPQTPGRTYTILRTTEIDGYELEKAAAAGLPAPGVLAPVPTGDNFQGTARKAAKLSISSAPTKSFNDLSTLLKSLPADSTMASLHPPITTTATSNRVAQEKRNVRLKAFLYAASHEADNDFHLIVGRDPAKLPEMYMTMELSGLPPTTAQSHAKLKTARDAYKGFFSANLPGMTYDFYHPPIPIAVEGSLFFDMTQATGPRPGPQSLKPDADDLGSTSDHEPRLRAIGASVGGKRNRPRSISRRRKGQDTVRPPRTGAPAADSVRAIVPFRSPSGRLYQIIKTTERDAYEKPARARAPKRRSKRNA